MVAYKAAKQVNGVFGAAVFYDPKKDLYFFCERKDLGKAKEILKSGLVVGFDNKRIDNKLILEEEVKSYDILEEIANVKYKVSSVEEAVELVGENKIKEISITSLCVENLKLKSRFSSFGDVPVLIEQNNWSGVFSHCLEETMMVYKLYEFIKKNGFVVIDGEKITINGNLAKRTDSPQK